MFFWSLHIACQNFRKCKVYSKRQEDRQIDLYYITSCYHKHRFRFQTLCYVCVTRITPNDQSKGVVASLRYANHTREKSKLNCWSEFEKSDQTRTGRVRTGSIERHDLYTVRVKVENMSEIHDLNPVIFFILMESFVIISMRSQWSRQETALKTFHHENPGEQCNLNRSPKWTDYGLVGPVQNRGLDRWSTSKVLDQTRTFPCLMSMFSVETSAMSLSAILKSLLLSHCDNKLFLAALNRTPGLLFGVFYRRIDGDLALLPLAQFKYTSNPRTQETLRNSAVFLPVANAGKT